MSRELMSIFVEDEDVKLKLGELSDADVRKLWIEWESDDEKVICMRNVML